MKSSEIELELQVDERSVPTSNLIGIKNKFRTFEKSCERLGVPAPTLTFVDLPYLESVDVSEGRTVLVEFQRVKIESYRPMLPGGYRLVAVVSSVEGNPIVTRLRDTDEIDLPSRIDPSVCDYCRKRRTRNNTFFVWSEEKKELRQVGGDCMEDFLGHDPYKVLAFVQAFADVEEEMSFDADFSQRTSDLRLVSFLTLVAYLSEKNGFVTKSEAEESLYDGKYPKEATSNAAVDLFRALNQSKVEWPASDRHAKVAKDAIAWALDLSGEREFERNLKTIASATMIPLKFAGLAAYVVGGFLKKKSKLQTASALKPVQDRGFVGKLEERQIFKGLLVSVKRYESDYGATFYHTISVGGDVVVWKGSKSIERATCVQNAEEMSLYLDIRGQYRTAVAGSALEKKGFTHHWDREKDRTAYLRFLRTGDTFFFLASVEKHEMYTPQYGEDRVPYPRTIVKRLQVLGDVRGEESYGAPVGELSASVKKKLDPSMRAEFEAYQAAQEALIVEQQQIVESIKSGRPLLASESLEQEYLVEKDATSEAHKIHEKINVEDLMTDEEREMVARLEEQGHSALAQQIRDAVLEERGR